MHPDTLDRVLLLGPPNAGKTTIFNWITGYSYKTVNYPGSTVDYHRGVSLAKYGDKFEVVDTPGVTSIAHPSDDEAVTIGLIEKGEYSKVIVVIDATQISRHLPLLRLLQQKGLSTVAAVTMIDMITDSDDFLSRLRTKLNCEVVGIDGRLGAGIPELIQSTQKQTSQKNQTVDLQSEIGIEKLMAEAKHISDFLQPKPQKSQHLTRKIDQYVLHPILGPLLFTLIMSFMFTSIYWLAAPAMEIIDTGFSWLGDSVIGIVGSGLLGRFLAEGLIAGLGAFLVFTPQIAILFFILVLLEDSGYLARAASIIDKPMSAVGLSGRSFTPIVAGFACAVPAIMATRQIPSKKERLLAIFILPLMTCSARLPVYGLLLGFLFWGEAAWKPGLILAALYLGSIVLGGAISALLSKFWKDENPGFLMLELPRYRAPRIKVVLRTVYDRTFMYVYKAGPIIFTISLLLWTGSNFPDYKNPDATQRMENSFLGQTGHALDGVMSPMGLDWRAGVALIASFAAREVFVSAMAIMYSVEESEDEEKMASGLLTQMKNARFSSGQPIFTFASASALLIFFMIALQCMSTFAISKQESKSWSLAVVQLVGFNLFAYVAAVITAQVLGS